ncbi:hypothetical protein JQX08_09980 [Pseudomonas sp. UL073]|uniref:Uncharacterized protein n=1 Tax=Zestomonas insulae TaxID=2809017 RepID=A0ABS2IE43_9GAMM|nr:hypothetical protein [Pseudomonas insulae]MBM7061035.1 hypothetical protein [Pseudomonas insulae]
MSRRTVLKGAVAAPALGLGFSVLSTPASASGSVHAMVYDSRFAASGAIADELMRMGIQQAPIEGDVTGVWFSTLDPLWAKRPATIAGLTSPAALLCLEQLAWNRHHRVVMRIDHVRTPGGGIEHRIDAPAELIPAMTAALREAPDWSRAVARLAGELPGPLFYSARMDQARVVVSKNAVPMGGQTHQVTWVIAADQTVHSSFRTA